MFSQLSIFVCSSTLLDYAMIFMTKPWLTEQATSLVIFILERWFVVHCIVELVMGNLFLFALKFLLWPMSNWWDLLTRLKLNSDGYYQIKHWGETYTVTTSYNHNNIDLHLQNTFYSQVLSHFYFHVLTPNLNCRCEIFLFLINKMNCFIIEYLE